MTEKSPDTTGEIPSAPRPLWVRLLPIAILAAGLIAFFAFGGQNYIGFEQIAKHRTALSGWVDQWGIWALLSFAVAYAVMVAFSIPGGAVATILGGFLFGLAAGTAVAVVGATLGSIGVFLAARTALGDAMRRKGGGALGRAMARMESGFRENAISYLLFLRLIPLFPFWLVNLVPALLGVPLRTYVTGTVLGIIPGTFVYTSVGNGLGALFDAGKTPDLGIIFKPEILLPILGLALLALLPAAYKKLRKRGSASSAGSD